MHAQMGWVLKIPHRLRDVCEIVIMLKVLHHVKLFYRRFFDNEYIARATQLFGAWRSWKKRKEILLFTDNLGFFKPFQTESNLSSFSRFNQHCLQHQHTWNLSLAYTELYIRNLSTCMHVGGWLLLSVSLYLRN